MALTAADYIRPLRTMNGGPLPLLQVNKESATTWSKGAIVVSSSGYAVAAGDTPAANTILGIAAEAAVAGTTTALIYPALPGVVFWSRIATGTSGGEVASAVTQRYVAGGYGLALDASGVYYIDVSQTTTDAVMITDLVDPVGTSWGAVEFVFIESAFMCA